jgi:hypothetical protein
MDRDAADRACLGQAIGDILRISQGYPSSLNRVLAVENASFMAV